MIRAGAFAVGTLLLLGASPSPALPRCSEGQLLVSTGDGFACKNLDAVLKAQRTSSWGAEYVLPECSSGAVAVSEGFGRWKCAEVAQLLPRCSSGETLRSEGSSGWRCERSPSLPSCSSGELLISTGSDSWGCSRPK